MKNHVDCVMTDRHSVVHPRVWQPWYIGGEERDQPLQKAPPLSCTVSGSPVDLRGSPSKELPTRYHKLQRNKERRELLICPSLLLLSRERMKRSSCEELNSVNGPSVDSRDGSNSEMEQVASDDDDDCLDEDDGSSDPERNAVLADDDDDDRRFESEESDDGESVSDIRHEGRLLVLRAGTNSVPTEDDDGPLDMTTSNRSRSRDAPSSSRSPSPPLYYGPPQPPPSFCPNPPLYSPYSSSAPPPPYHPPAAHRPSPSSSASPPAATASGSGSSARFQQQHRPSVITCAPAALRGATQLPHGHPHHHRSGPFSMRSTPPPSTTVTTAFLRAAEQSATAVQRNGVVAVAAARRTLSDPIPGHSGAPAGAKGRRSSDLARPGHRREILSGVCDPVIDEHFRRSLGKDYPEFLATTALPSTSSSLASTSVPGQGPSSVHGTPSTNSTSISITGMSVDDHFAKALGETWLRLQNQIATAPPAASKVSQLATSGSGAAATTIPTSTVSTSSSPSSSSTDSPSPGPRADSAIKMPASPLQQSRQSGMVSS